MMKYSISSFIFSLLLLVIAAPPAQAKIFDIQTTTLENGMQVVFIPNNRAPVVTHMVWIKAGAVDEKPGHTGLAHFLEHLMFKGTDKTGPGEFSRIVKSFGAEHNAFTSKDFTAYFETLSTSHLGDVMRLNADRLQNLAPPMEEVESERDVVLEERRQRVENNPMRQFQEHLRASFYLTHPYARPVVGWMDELKKINWDHALDFYKKWYVPNNMILVVTGDVSFDEVVRLAREHYGPMKAKALPERGRPVLPALIGQKTLRYEGDDVFQSRLFKLYAAPNYTDDKNKALALQVLQEIISGAPTTYLHQKLVVDQKLASSINVYYSDYARYQTLVYVVGTPVEGISPERLDREIDNALRQLYETNLSEDMVTNAKKRLVAEAIYARDSLSGPAMIVGRALSVGVSIDDIENWDKNIANVPFDDVREALGSIIISPGHAPVTGYLTPAADKNTDDRTRNNVDDAMEDKDKNSGEAGDTRNSTQEPPQ